MRASAACVLLLLASGVARAQQPAVTEYGLETSAEQLVVHQQLVVTLRVVHALFAKPQWETPAFEGFWTERMNSSGSPLRRDEQGRPIRTTTFRRALFPSRVGELAIEASRLIVQEAGGVERTLEIPRRLVQVSEPPAEGRPEGWSGVVGELRIHVSVDRDEVEVGRALPVTINLFGEANVWDARLPEPDALFGADLEVFPSRPQLIKTTHGGTLRARRTLDFELVSGRAGLVTLPAVEVPYYDPGEGAYRVARSEPLSFRSVPVGRRNPRRPWEEPAVVHQPFGTTQLVLGALFCVALLAASGAGLAWWWRLGRRRFTRTPLPRPQVLLQRAREAAERDDFPARLREALLAGLWLRHGFDPQALTTEEIARRVDDSEAVELLAALDRVRFTRAAGDSHDLLARVGLYLAR